MSAPTPLPRNHRLAIYLLPLLLPILIVISVNEYARKNINDQPARFQQLQAMNPHKADKTSCNWQCYHNTTYCKQYHTKMLQGYSKEIDPLYFGMIRSLKATGNYAGANFIFLVILWPLLMYLLLVKLLKNRYLIASVKNNMND